jgi:hypothetical protein
MVVVMLLSMAILGPPSPLPSPLRVTRTSCTLRHCAAC